MEEKLLCKRNQPPISPLYAGLIDLLARYCDTLSHVSASAPEHH